MISSMTADLSVIVAISFFIAGIIKGVIGIGLPTTALTLLTISVSPLEAIGLNVMPMVITNLYQLFRAENIKQLFSSYWRFASILIIFMTGSALLAASLGNDIIRLMIALSILAFTLNQLFGHALYLPSHLDRLFQYVLGGLAGIIGGLTSTWGVPITIYLVMKNVSPRQFIDATGFLITAGCVPIIFGYSMTSVFHFGILGYGILGSFTAIIGFAIGEHLRPFISAAFFRKLVLILFLFMGIRLGFASLTSFMN